MKNKNKIIGALVAIVVLIVGYALFSSKGNLLTGKITLQPSAACLGPYHVQTKAGCVWSCGTGTQPDDPNNRFGQCVCKSGYQEISTDALGRRICKQGSATPVPPPPPPEPPTPPTPTLLPASVSPPLLVIGSMVPGHCNAACIRGSGDNIFQVTLTGQSGVNIFDPARHSITLHLESWSFSASAEGLPVRMIDAYDRVRGIGYIHRDGYYAYVVIVPSAELRLNEGESVTYQFRVATDELLITDTIDIERLRTGLDRGAYRENDETWTIPGDVRYYNDLLGEMAWADGFTPMADYNY